MIEHNRNLLAGAWAALIALLPAPASADHLFGNINGKPHQAVHDPPRPGLARLDPDPVVGIHMGNCPWLLPALAVQGFDADGLDNIAGNADDWTVTFGSLSAMSLKVELYAAFVDTNPANTCGTFKIDADTDHHTGGAEFCLTYRPHDGDPKKDAAHWLQVIKTN